MNKNLLCLSALSVALLAATSALAATATYTGAGTPIGIPDAGAAVTSTATAPGPAAPTAITDVDVTVGITHTWADDIDISLSSTNPAVAATVLIQDCAGSGDYANTFTFDDSSPNVQDCTSAGTTVVGSAGTIQSPEGAATLALFNGAVAVGPSTWTLSVADDSSICTGSFDSFSVTVTSDAALPVELSTFSVD